MCRMGPFLSTCVSWLNHHPNFRAGDFPNCVPTFCLMSFWGKVTGIHKQLYSLPFNIALLVLSFFFFLFIEFWCSLYHICLQGKKKKTQPQWLYFLCYDKLTLWRSKPLPQLPHSLITQFLSAMTSLLCFSLRASLCSPTALIFKL